MNPRIALTASICVLTSLSASAQSLQWTTTVELPGVFGDSFWPQVAALEVFDDGSGAALYAGGGFVKAGGASTKCLARWNGFDWSPVAHGLNPFPTSAFNIYALLADGPHLYFGGTLPGAIVPRAFVGQIGSSTGLIGTFETGTEDWGEVLALAVFDGNPAIAGPELYAAGRFRPGSILWREGTVWRALGSGAMPGVMLEPPSSGVLGPARVHALQVFDNGSGDELYVGGFFYFVDGAPQRTVARWDGSTWSGFSGPITEFGTCTSFAVFDDRSGSGPALFAGSASGRVMRLVGTSWSELTTSNGPVYALEVFDHGAGRALYVAGDFTSIGGTAASGIAKWDGSGWSALAGGLGVGPGSHPLAMHGALAPGISGGEALYVGGSFASADGTPVDKIVAWYHSDIVGTPYCFGDGSLPTPCPCAPPDVVPSPSGAADAGCANSFNSDGAQLLATGPLDPDQARLHGMGLTPVGLSLLIVGNGSDPAGVAGGDGLRCVGGTFFRFGVQNAVNGTIVYPNPALGLIAPLSLMSGVVPGSGQARYYQAFYRSAQPGFCNPATFNFTSAVALVW